MNEPAPRLNQSLRQQLNALLDSHCGQDDFLREVAVLCAARTDSAWEVLSLLDQSYRLGKVSPDLFRAAKARIEQRALGIRGLNKAPAANQTELAIVDQRELELRALRSELQQARTEAAAYREKLNDTLQRTSAQIAPPVLAELLPLVQALPPPPQPLVQLQPVKGLVSIKPPADRTKRLRNLALIVPALIFAMIWAAYELLPAPAPVPASPARVIAPPIAVAPVEPPKPAAPIKVNFSAHRYVVSPGKRSAQITVVREPASSGEADFVWWTEAGGAKPGKDFVAQGRQKLTIPAAQDQVQFVVPIRANRARKHIELFYVRLGKLSDGAKVRARDGATVFIMP